MNLRLGRILGSRFVLPVLWALGGLVALLASPRVGPSLVGDPTAQDTYYVVPHRHLALGLPGAFALFAAAYLALALTLPRFRRAFGFIHFVLMAIGVELTYAPPVFLTVGGWPRRFEDPQQALAFWQTIQTVGEGLTLAGMGFFAAAVFSGFRRRLGSATP